MATKQSVDAIEIRVTRPAFYPRDCQNPEYQQGHYFRGVDLHEAREKAEAKFPGEYLHVAVFKKLVNGVWVRQ